MAEENVCKACDGSGLQSDDENWKYPCSVCGGDGILKPDESREPSKSFSVDENNRTME